MRRDNPNGRVNGRQVMGLKARTNMLADKKANEAKTEAVLAAAKQAVQDGRQYAANMLVIQQVAAASKAKPVLKPEDISTQCWLNHDQDNHGCPGVFGHQLLNRCVCNCH